MLEWLINIGKAIGEEYTFRMYASQIEALPLKTIYYSNNTDVPVPYFDGMTMIERYILGEGFLPSDKVTLIDKRHNDLVRFYIQKMFTKYMANFCPPGYVCLEGVSVDESKTDDYLISTPFVCASGSYCLRGAQSVIGSGLCPVGFYCPRNSAFP